MDVLASRTIIRPSDLDRSLTFYAEGLHLPVARQFGQGADRGVVFFAGGGMIEVVGAGPPQPTTGGQATPETGRVVLWLQVRSLDAAMAELAGRGVVVIRPPTHEPWGLIEAWIDDPDGIRIHLVEVPADHPLRQDQRHLTTQEDLR